MKIINVISSMESYSKGVNSKNYKDAQDVYNDALVFFYDKSFSFENLSLTIKSIKEAIETLFFINNLKKVKELFDDIYNIDNLKKILYESDLRKDQKIEYIDILIDISKIDLKYREKSKIENPDFDEGLDDILNLTNLRNEIRLS